MEWTWRVGLSLLWVSTFAACAQTRAEQIVIAHRGASGYLPEHTLPGKALAYDMGANFLEQDVVSTGDDQLIVLHDIYLDTVTDVARRFPERARADGRFYAIDFTLAEIKQLRVRERIDLASREPVYPRRFPSELEIFTVPTLAEEVAMIQGMNRSSGKAVGIYVEIKRPAWHRKAGKDLTRMVWDALQAHGYGQQDSNCYVQYFDPAALRRLRAELQCPLRLVQLIGENSWQEADCDYGQMRTEDGITAVAAYADAIGPKLDHIVASLDASGRPVLTGLVAAAHERGLQVHAYTFRADDLPPGVPSMEVLLGLFLYQADVDGVFTDFPDRAVRLMQRERTARQR